VHEAEGLLPLLHDNLLLPDLHRLSHIVSGSLLSDPAVHLPVDIPDLQAFQPLVLPWQRVIFVVLQLTDPGQIAADDVESYL
jgi:hypothetical protein